MRTKAFAIVCSAALIVSGLVPVAAADKGDKQVRFGLIYSMPTDDLVDAGQKTELDNALGFQAAFEFLVTDRIGIEPGVSYTSHDLSVKEMGFPDQNGDTSLLAVTANVNFHFRRDGGTDLFLGPTLGYASWDDIHLDGFPMAVSTDSEFLYGANFGADIPFGEGGWAFNLGLAYLALDLSPSGGTIGVSPVQAKVGVTKKF